MVNSKFQKIIVFLHLLSIICHLASNTQHQQLPNSKNNILNTKFEMINLK